MTSPDTRQRPIHLQIHAKAQAKVRHITKLICKTQITKQNSIHTLGKKTIVQRHNFTKAKPMHIRTKTIPCIDLLPLCKLMRGTFIMQALQSYDLRWAAIHIHSRLDNTIAMHTQTWGYSRSPHHAKDNDPFHAKTMLSPCKDIAMRQALYTNPYNSHFYAYG